MYAYNENGKTYLINEEDFYNAISEVLDENINYKEFYSRIIEGYYSDFVQVLEAGIDNFIESCYSYIELALQNYVLYIDDIDEFDENACEYQDDYYAIANYIDEVLEL